MEAKKSYSRLSASWRGRKAGGVVQSKSESLGIGAQQRKSSPEPEIPRIRCPSVQGQDKMGALVQTKSEFTLPPPFCSTQALKRLDEALLFWWGRSLFNLLNQMLISSKTPSPTHPEIMFHHGSGHLLAQSSSHKINHQNYKAAHGSCSGKYPALDHWALQPGSLDLSHS